MMDKAHIETVRLLLESAPAIFEAPHFAMKGGTAISNLARLKKSNPQKFSQQADELRARFVR
jgi:hypothetical protein